MSNLEFTKIFNTRDWKIELSNWSEFSFFMLIGFDAVLRLIQQVIDLD